jgi:hypothetical protein
MLNVNLHLKSNFMTLTRARVLSILLSIREVCLIPFISIFHTLTSVARCHRAFKLLAIIRLGRSLLSQLIFCLVASLSFHL